MLFLRKKIININPLEFFENNKGFMNLTLQFLVYKKLFADKSIINNTSDGF